MELTKAGLIAAIIALLILATCWFYAGIQWQKYFGVYELTIEITTQSGPEI